MPLSDVAKIYWERVNADVMRLSKKSSIPPTRFYESLQLDDEGIDMRAHSDAVGIYNDCCRTKLNTAMQWCVCA
jgi:hypothetical protein